MYDNLVCSQLCGFDSDFGLSSLPSKFITLSAHLHNNDKPWQLGNTILMMSENNQIPSVVEHPYIYIRNSIVLQSKLKELSKLDFL